MVKRASIKFSGTTNRFRVTPPGLDVDTATPNQHLIHESFFYPGMIDYVYLPKIGDTSSTYYLPFTLPYTPFCLAYLLFNDGKVYAWHRNLDETQGIPQQGNKILGVKSTPSSVTISYPSISTISGIYLIVYRNPIL